MKPSRERGWKRLEEGSREGEREGVGEREREGEERKSIHFSEFNV